MCLGQNTAQADQLFQATLYHNKIQFQQSEIEKAKKKKKQAMKKNTSSNSSIVK